MNDQLPKKRGRPKNIHVHAEMQEVWDSFEWLFREKLESMDSMTRTMIREMQMTGANLTQIRRFIPQRFSGLWESVADEGERKAK